jgi:hypothetical protein
MLLCKQTASRGIWYTLHQLSELEAATCRAFENEGNPMSKTASAALRAPSAGLLSRLFVAVDRFLLTYAQMTIRNGDIPHHGV